MCHTAGMVKPNGMEIIIELMAHEYKRVTALRGGPLDFWAGGVGRLWSVQDIF